MKRGGQTICSNVTSKKQLEYECSVQTRPIVICHRVSNDLLLYLEIELYFRPAVFQCVVPSLIPYHSGPEGFTINFDNLSIFQH